MFQQLKILRAFKNSSYQFFLQWFADACEEAGVAGIDNIKIHPKVRLLIAKSRLSRQLPFLKKSDMILIVPCCGYPDSFCFPFGYTYDIVPVLWDTWPRYHNRIILSFKRHHVKIAFFTQRIVAEKMQSLLPDTECRWLPEGINAAAYSKGDLLSVRSTDVLEFGRVNTAYHAAISARRGGVMFRLPKDGLLFKDFDSLKQGLASSRIVINFPRCDTNPEMAGGIETLTQRYWECMLSRTLMVGRAPKELVDFIGYNPVIDVDWNNPRGQLVRLLANIDRYQGFVDKNFDVAALMAPWSKRVSPLIDSIQQVYADFSPMHIQPQKGSFA